MEPELLPTTMWKTCPIRSSLGVLGRQWAFLVLRDVSFFRRVRFSDFLRNSPGLNPRLLSVRLRERQKEGLIAREVDSSDRRQVFYRLTPKGRDVIPVLTALIQYGAKHRAREVFPDRTPRPIDELFPARREYLLGDLYGYARSPEPKGATNAGASSPTKLERK